MGSDPFLAEVESYTIQPEREAFPSPQATETAIGLQKDFLSHILSIMEIAEFSIHKGIDTGLIFVYKYTESPRLSI